MMTATNDPITVPWIIRKGGTWADTIAVKENGIAKDLTGYTARLQIRDHAAGTVLVSLTTENGGLLILGALGYVGRRIEAAVTTAFTWSRAVYDLELILPSGDVWPLMQGPVVANRETTHV